MRRIVRIRTRNRRAVRDEMREEIEAHIALCIDQLIRRGVPPDEALAQARARFGDFSATLHTLIESAQHREDLMKRREFWSDVRQDLVLSFRQMRRAPGFAATVMLTLALGIGANLVVFDVANRLLLSPPPGVHGMRDLVVMKFPQGGTSPRSVVTNYATLRDLDSARSFASIGGYGYPRPASLGHGPDASGITVNAATASFFTTIGAVPAVGRFFLPSDDAPPAGARVAVISHSLWRRAFGGNSSAIGSQIEVGGQSYTIVGVAEPHFNGIDLSPVDVWLPMTAVSYANYGNTLDYATDRRSKWMMLVGRLRSGVLPAQAASEVSLIFARNNQEIRNGATDRAFTAVMESAMPGANDANASTSKVSAWLLGLAAIVLLIACANVMTLLLVRATRRTREMAVRLSLGISRGRLTAQLLTENAVFAAGGAAVAFVASLLSRGFIQSVLLPDTELGPGVSIGSIGLALGIVIAIALVTSAVPIAQLRRVDLATALRSVSGRIADTRRVLRSSLLILQVALSVLLLVGSGLFVRSLQNARSTRIGLDPDAVAIAEVRLDPDRQDEFWAEAVTRVRRLPGVENAAVSVNAPMRMTSSGTFFFPGDTLRTLATGGPYRFGVDPSYFATLGAQLRRGRNFTDADTRTSSRVVIVNETLARLVAERREPLGACVRIFRADSIPCATIVGVVENITRYGLGEGESAQYYVPLAQWTNRSSRTLFVRIASAGALGLVQRELQRIRPDVPYPQVHTIAQLLDPQLRPWRLGATMFTLFGVLAFVVAAVGLYGLLAYSVAQRQHEFGIRTAAGARASDIARLVISSAATLVTIGLVVGLGAAAVAARWIAPLLYQVDARDMFVYGAIVLGVLSASVLVSVVPARRAAAVDPASALRAE